MSVYPIECTANFSIYSGLGIHLKDCLYSQLRMYASMPGMLHACFVCVRACVCVHFTKHVISIDENTPIEHSLSCVQSLSFKMLIV